MADTAQGLVDAYKELKPEEQTFDIHQIGQTRTESEEGKAKDAVTKDLANAHKKLKEDEKTFDIIVLEPVKPAKPAPEKGASDDEAAIVCELIKAHKQLKPEKETLPPIYTIPQSQTGCEGRDTKDLVTQQLVDDYNKLSPEEKTFEIYKLEPVQSAQPALERGASKNERIIAEEATILVDPAIGKVTTTIPIAESTRIMDVSAVILS